MSALHFFAGRVALLALIAGSTLVAQYDVRGSLRLSKTSASQGSLTISMPALPAGSDWIIGVRPGTGDAVSAGAADVRVTTHPSGARLISNIVEMSAGLTLSPGLIEYSGPAPGGALVIYAAIPVGTKVRVRVEGVTIADLTPAQGLLVHRGRVYPEAVRGFESVLQHLLLSDETKSDPSLNALRDGTYLAPSPALKANLLNFTRPQLAPGTTIQNRNAALVRVIIDEQGRVAEVLPVRGDPLFVNAVKAALPNWRFTPFTVNGKAVRVTGSILFVLNQDNTIAAPTVMN